MGTSERDLLWAGIAIALWVLYQSATGGFAYKGRGFRREEDPPLFWGAMAFEGLFAVNCIGLGLGLTWLAVVAFGLFALMDIALIAWFVGRALNRMRKYPRISRLFLEDMPAEAAAELRSHLGAHPGDREAMFMLAGAYEKAGERVAAWDVYADLACGDDRWGRGARRYLRRHGREGGQREATGRRSA